MRHLRSLVLLLGMAFILSSCAKKEAVSIVCYTGPSSGALYPLGVDVCGYWTSQLNYVTAEASVSAGGVENLELLRNGEIQIGMSISRNCYESYTGTGSFQGQPNKNLRVIAGLYLNPNHLVVSNDSDIDSIRDLRGKSISVGMIGSSTEGEAMYHLEAVGLKYPDDIELLYTDFTDAVSLIADKSLDGAWIMAGIGNAAVTEASSKANAKILDIDSDVISRLLTVYPWYAEYTIPANTYTNQELDVHTTATKMLMFTTAELDDDTVYDLTKIFWKNIKSLEKNSSALKGITPESALANIANLPIHAGAEKFYREVGAIK